MRALARSVTVVLIVCHSLGCAQPLDEGGALAAGRGVSVSLDDMEAIIPAGSTVAQVVGRVRQEAEQRALAHEARKRGIAQRPVVRRRIRRLVISAYRQELMRSVKREAVTDEDLRGSFLQRAGIYDQPELVRTSQIVVQTKAEAEQRLRQCGKGLLAGAAQREFASCARKHSLHRASAQRGGDLGYFKIDSVHVPVAVRKLAFSLKLNEIGGPVEGVGKWYLVMKTGERKAMKRSFESVKEGLRMRILERKRRELVKKEFDRIIKEADIKLNEDAIARLQKKLNEERAQKRRARR